MSAPASSKTPREKILDWISFVASIIALPVAIVTCIETFKAKSHELEIAVTDVRIVENKVRYGVAFYNTGDFVEIISNAESILGQHLDDESLPLRWEQNRCFEPAVVKPKETVYLTYVTEYAINDLKQAIFPMQRGEYTLSIDFEILSQKQGVVTERIPVGIMRKRASDDPSAIGNYADFQFASVQRKVNFEKAKPRIVQASYPTDKEFTIMSLCKRLPKVDTASEREAAGS